MKLLLCILLPAVLISILYLAYKHINDNKITIKGTVGFYLFSTVIINIIMIVIVFLFKDVFLWKYTLTKSFIIKYVLLGSLIGLIVPFILKKLKDNTITKINKEYKIFNFNYDNLKKYFEKNKESKYKIIYFVSGFLLFFVLDFLLRQKICSLEHIATAFNINANVITFFFTFLFLFVVYYLPKKSGKVIAIILYVLSIGLYIAHYFYFCIKSDALSIYELNNAKEGLSFINAVLEYINLKFILIVLFLIVSAIINYRALRKITKKLQLKKLIISIIICIMGINVGILLFKEYDESMWNSIDNKKYYYENFISPRKSLSILGLYEYTVRDIHLYVEGLFKKYGSPEEIKDLMNKYHTELETNDYTGIFKDKNVIMIMMESIDYVVVNEKAMPTLYNMMNKGWSFPERYNQGGEYSITIATEYTSMSGLFHSGKFYNQLNNNYYNNSLPSVLNREGYKTSSFHENTGNFYERKRLHRNLGFQNSYFLRDMKDQIDVQYMYDPQFASNDELYEKVVSKDSKFMSFIITISGHLPYKDSEFCESTMTELECFSYLAKETDDLIRILSERLEQDGLLDDTVFVLYADHNGYGYNYTEEDLKQFKKIDSNGSIKHIPLVIYNSKMEHKQFDNIYFNDVDLVPTLFNLLGIKYNPDNYIGRDVFSKAHNNFIYFNSYAWYDGTTYSANMVSRDITDDTKKYNEYVSDKLKLNDMILSNNYYKDIN